MITLTHSDNHRHVYINPNEIQALIKSPIELNGRYSTRITLKGQSGSFWADGYITVRESPKEVLAMIEEAKE